MGSALHIPLLKPLYGIKGSGAPLRFCPIFPRTNNELSTSEIELYTFGRGNTTSNSFVAAQFEMFF
jgi:hypothetical protein